MTKMKHWGLFIGKANVPLGAAMLALTFDPKKRKREESPKEFCQISCGGSASSR